MKKNTALTIVILSVLCGAGAISLNISGYIPLWVLESVLVCAFPLIVLFLGLWWMAKESEEDIPFIGY